MMPVTARTSQETGPESIHLFSRPNSMSTESKHKGNVATANQVPEEESAGVR